MPIAQHMITRLPRQYMRAASSISAKVRPDCAWMCDHGVASTTARYSSTPWPCSAMKAWSNTAGSPLAWVSRSHCRANLAMPRSIAMSPPRAGRKKAVLVGRSLLVSISSGFWGCWKRSRPRSLSGLMHTT
ncbi:hypothetical protein D9M73_181770 [compost metagenome]